MVAKENIVGTQTEPIEVRIARVKRVLSMIKDKESDLYKKGLATLAVLESKEEEEEEEK